MEDILREKKLPTSLVSVDWTPIRKESSRGDAARERPFGQRPAFAGRSSLRHYAER